MRFRDTEHYFQACLRARKGTSLGGVPKLGDLETFHTRKLGDVWIFYRLWGGGQLGGGRKWLPSRGQAGGWHHTAGERLNFVTCRLGEEGNPGGGLWAWKLETTQDFWGGEGKSWGGEKLGAFFSLPLHTQWGLVHWEVFLVLGVGVSWLLCVLFQLAFRLVLCCIVLYVFAQLIFVSYI